MHVRGRPARITRVRLAREWREECVYGPETPAERHLVFSNGKLVDFGLRPADERLAVALPPSAERYCERTTPPNVPVHWQNWLCPDMRPVKPLIVPVSSTRSNVPAVPSAQV